MGNSFPPNVTSLHLMVRLLARLSLSLSVLRRTLLQGTGHAIPTGYISPVIFLIQS